MKFKKQVAKVMIMALLMMTFSLSTFAEVAETTEEVAVVDEVVAVVDEVELVNAIIKVDLGYSVLITVDEFGVIISAEIIEEEPIVEEPVVEEPVVDEPVVDEPVVDEPVVDEPVVDEPVVDEPVVDEPVVEEPIVDEPVIDNPLALLIGLSITDGIQMLVDAVESDEEFDFNVEIYADDENAYALLSELVYTAFGDVVKVESEESLDDYLNPNFERFENAKLFGITNGKMNLLEKLGLHFKEDSAIDYSEWANKSVKEIMSEIKSYKKGLKSEDQNIEEEDSKDEEVKVELEVKNKSEVKEKSENKGKGKNNKK